MQKKCDLYLCVEVEASQIRMLRLFDKSFFLEEGMVRSGYLFVNVDRIKLVAVVADFHRRNIPCFSVPVEYRNSIVTYDAAFEIAKKQAAEKGAVVGQVDQVRCPPLFWSFSLSSIGSSEKKVGGVLMIDRLDGHPWGQDEYEEYMYDYNNIF